MTDLNKAVRRRGTVPVHALCYRKLVVQLEPGDVLAMREDRRRQWVRATFAELYTMLLQSQAVKADRQFRKRVAELIKAGNSRREAKKQARAEARAN